MSRLFFSPASRADLNSIVEHISTDNPNAAAGFVKELKER